MRMLEPLRHDARAPLARRHPLAKLAAGAILMLVVFLTVDPVTPAVVLAALLAAVPASGLAFGPLARRAAPLALAAAGVGLFNGLVSGDLAAGAAVALRVVAVALSGILAVATIDPTDLADALIEHLRVSPRFAVGALAAFRLAPLFAREWERIALARRARGIEADRSFAGRLVTFPERTHALLVGAIRRATDLALAMDARGFGARGCRTVSRPRPLRSADLGLALLAAGVGIAATAASLAAGTWRPLFSG
ncbi:MAG TPA: energy-coupling factor transporter transmembrane component T [Candidatus Limnocylindria bacterium]|nr:energy-coupling factor transporter transmembrane component T [Candidatus Limnocylindria bacterium]